MNVLVVQTAFLGDIVLTTPLLRELRKAHPSARIVALTTRLGAAALDGLPYLDEILTVDKRARGRGVGETLRVAARLRRQRPDLAFAAQRSFRTGFLLRASGAQVRVGFSGAPGSWAYTAKVAWEPSSHAVRRYLELSAPAGGRPDLADPRPELAVTERAAERVASLLCAAGIAERDPVLAVAPGSIWGTKRWPAEGFASVVRAGAARELRAVLTGSADERALCLRVAELSGSPALVLAGETSIQEVTALLARSRALVTNDSGPGHVAAAVGTPVVAIFGPTIPGFGYAPFGPEHRIVEHPALDCRPCDRHGPRVCPLAHHRCMHEVAPERVVAALDEILASR